MRNGLPVRYQLIPHFLFLISHSSFLIDSVDTHKTPYNDETSPRGNIGLSLSGRFADIPHFSFLISHSSFLISHFPSHSSGLRTVLPL